MPGSDFAVDCDFLRKSVKLHSYFVARERIPTRVKWELTTKQGANSAQRERGKQNEVNIHQVLLSFNI